MWHDLLPGLPYGHPVFAGHFPGRPMLPGAMLLDALLHALVRPECKDFANCRILSAKFLSPVRPGDALVFRHEAASGGMSRFEIRAGARKIATGSLQLAHAIS